ncbi:GNAT superfamily N-acetyltransferase [Azospirillum fermentarium]|uniref:GNAT family N-acetyltransferase n=1 Tax=Azospirillum fermentarium TaxID=1233114 RepID=UPI002225C78B|nr:GNAT family N-acetyltransferase [Azospirillum fermentarium]MCW2246049.1 GNAT superfamily N-acetyltransferase [Azospirillum fermentarium]
MTMEWRPMTHADLPAVLAAADAIHTDYPERVEVFADRLSLFPDGCLIAGNGDALVGYGVMHPGMIGYPPALDSLLERLPAGADCLYLHDIALLPAARGHRLGEAVLGHAHRVARKHGLPWLALTSTPPARSYWLARGFTPSDAGGAALAAKLASYGEGMMYMTQAVR